MSDEYSRRDRQQSEEVKLYRQQRVNEFRLNIEDDDSNKPSEKPDFSDEITSFSDENTKAQIERASKKELRRQKKEERQIQKIKADRNKKVYRIAWLALVIIISFVVAQLAIVGSNDFLAITRDSEELATIKIAADDSIESIARKLKDKDVINSTEFFVLFSEFTGKGGDIEPGVYQVPKNKDYLGIINFLQNQGNRKTTITLQFTEGSNIQEIAQQLYEAGVTYDVDEFLSLCNSDEFDDEYDFIADIEASEDRIYKLEGYLFPDTYEFYVDEAPDITIRRFLTNFNTKVFKTEYKVDGYHDTMTLMELINETHKYSLDDVVNMASLVQAEAADKEDMYNVSSVIHNRLDFGAQHDIHSLGLDCTAFYPYKNIDAVPEDMRETFNSTYETYNSEGLPPGAVCSPSAEALLAAVAPNDTDYLYFCHGVGSDGTMAAYYAVTFSEHQANLYKAGLV